MKDFGFSRLRVLFTFLAIFGLFFNADALHSKGRGLKELSQDDIQKIEKNSHWIVKVNPNKIGAARIHHHLKKQNSKQLQDINIPISNEEIVTQEGLPVENTDKIQNAIADTPLPSSVNNSLLASFPPIGDQGPIGSCVGWGSTYYQATHEYGLLNGLNNKTSSNNIFSPKWTYNLLNGGGDNGLYPEDAFILLSQNGAASITDFPYDNDYLEWDLHPQDWVSAASHRMTPARMIAGLGGKQQNLKIIKQLLNNGHILTFATYVDSWVYTTVKKDPANPNSPAVGQQAVSWMNGRRGGHFLTIVGYNDDVWIDVNGNNKVDDGEKGAFLIANSWGANWGNDGYIWISYDAFLAASAVSGGPSRNRVPLGDAMSSYVASIVPIASNYVPKLVAQFTLNQRLRNQISIGAGVSDSDQNSPTVKFKSGALTNQGGPFEFDGNNPASTKSGTFALDLTDLIPAQTNPTASHKYYLLLGDSKIANPTTLTSFSLLDQFHKTKVDYAQVPLVCDLQNVTPFIEYDFYSGQVQDDSAPVINITSPASGSTLDGVVDVVASATSTIGIAKVEFYIDSNLINTDSAAPYVVSVDTNELSDGLHEFKAVAYDTANNTSQSAIAVTVKNTTPGFRVNCGGDDVVYQGITWSKDNGYTSPSGVLSTLLKFANPVYRSERNGNFSYQFNVDNGPYTVTLKFAELRYQAKGKRVFNVAINGAQVITKLDLVRTAGYAVPYDRSFTVNVTNNKIKIDFIPVIYKAKVNGIEIVPQ